MEATLTQGMEISRITSDVYGIKIMVGGESAGIHVDRAFLEALERTINDALVLMRPGTAFQVTETGERLHLKRHSEPQKGIKRHAKRRELAAA